MAKEEIPDRVPPSSITLEQTVEQLGIDEEAVELLLGQGRLQGPREDGVLKYTVACVLRVRAEDLIRELLAEANKSRPELCQQIEELASIQYQRGTIDGMNSLGELAYWAALAEGRKLGEQLRERRNHPNTSSDSPSPVG